MSHALVAVAAVGLTAGGYMVYDALSDTARMLSGDNAPAAREPAARAEPRGDAPADDRERKRDHKDHEPKPDAAVAQAEVPPADAERDRAGGGRAATRAAELGITAHELRERRAERDGLSVDEFKARKDARGDWRSQQDPEDLHARKEARRLTLTPEQLQQAQELKDQRHELFEADPSLKDAADAMRKLKDMAGEAPPSP
ncbi:MAG TPA: hypothetical protein PKA64_04320 [Myxococcota bacterium]|nr:hypothetical protein [Myxococcota bacterium]